MDFKDSPEEAAFRLEVRSWLEENVPKDHEWEGWSEIKRAKLWQQRKFDADWACLRWPKEYGGRELSAINQVIWNSEEAKFQLPEPVFMIGLGMAAPTIMTWGSEAHKSHYLPRIASGEDIWCQMFSEPAGGSDLAALRTKAERSGDDWVINGQKIWTSGAHYSDLGLLVVRTDPGDAKHAGLSYFIVDMTAPGIEVKPIKQITGQSTFNEVYFTDLRVPDDQRLGEVGQGWQVALTTLMNERSAIGGLGTGRGVGFRQAYELASRIQYGDQRAIDDPSVRAKLADWYTQESGLKYTRYRSMTALSRGSTPGPENSISKLVSAPKAQEMASFCIDLLEMSGAMWDPEQGKDYELYQQAFMSSPGMRIAGGTDEIMANIVAERVLGLPQEPRSDKGIPFDEIPTGV